MRRKEKLFKIRGAESLYLKLIINQNLYSSCRTIQIQVIFLRTNLILRLNMVQFHQFCDQQSQEM